MLLFPSLTFIGYLDLDLRSSRSTTTVVSPIWYTWLTTILALRELLKSGPWFWWCTFIHISHQDRMGNKIYYSILFFDYNNINVVCQIQFSSNHVYCLDTRLRNPFSPNVPTGSLKLDLAEVICPFLVLMSSQPSPDAPSRQVAYVFVTLKQESMIT